MGKSSPASTRLPQASTATTTRDQRSPSGLGGPSAGYRQVKVVVWKVWPEGQDVQLVAEAPWQV